METKNIILTGFMGTGKSTVGRLVAAKLSYEFVDSDHLIEQKAGKSIPEIFSELGEKEFRRMENETAVELAGRRNLVIATGGKLMLDPGNSAVLCETGSVFCLTASPETITKRVMEDMGTERPLLNTPDPVARIESLLSERKEGYERFTQIETSDKNPEDIAEEIVRLVIEKE